MKKLIKIGKALGIGAGQGIASPIIEIYKTIKKFSGKGAREFLDTNGDGRVTLEDIQDLQWQTLAKLATIIGILWLLVEKEVVSIEQIIHFFE